MPARSVRSLTVLSLLAAALGAAPSNAFAAGDPTVVAGHKTGPVALSGRSVPGTVASLPVSAGNWSISAKLDVVAVTPNARRASCRLVAGGDYDQSAATLNGSVSSQERASLLLLVTHTFGSAGSIQLRCSSNGSDGDVTAQYVRIIATRASRLDRYDLSTTNGPTITGLGNPRVVTGWLNGPVATTTISGTTAALPLSPGNWAIQAKAVLTAGPSAASDTESGCILRAGGDFDDTAERNLPAGSMATQALEVVHHFATSDVDPAASVSCTGIHVTVSSVKITALKVGTLTNQPLPGTGATSVGSGSPVVRAGYIDHGYLRGGGAYSNWASIHVPAGSWAVIAKLTPFADIGNVAQIWCELASGSLFDRSRLQLLEYDVPPGHDISSMSLALTRTITAATGGTFLVRCADEGDPSDAIDLEYIKIIAVKAGSLSDAAL
jgi:hypothetical protein